MSQLNVKLIKLILHEVTGNKMADFLFGESGSKMLFVNLNVRRFKILYIW